MYAEAALGSTDGIFPDLRNCDTDPDVSDVLSDSDESDIIDNHQWWSFLSGTFGWRNGGHTKWYRRQWFSWSIDLCLFIAIR